VRIRQEKDELEYGAEKLRLFVRARLIAGEEIAATPGQAHYLIHVMRARAGAALRVFNGHDGEWRARIRCAARRWMHSESCDTEILSQSETPDLWLAFAPIKKNAGGLCDAEGKPSGCARASARHYDAHDSTAREPRAHERQCDRGGGAIGPPGNSSHRRLRLMNISRRSAATS